MTETSPLRWFAPVPARRLTLVRSLTFGYAAAWLVVRGVYIVDVARLPDRRYEPIGVLHLAASPPPGEAIALIWVVTIVACAAVTMNRRVRLSAPIGAAGMLVLATYTSAFGQVFHTEHLLVLHVAVLAVAALVEPAVRAASDDATSDEAVETSGWPLNLMMAVTVVTYVVAGVAKLRYSGIEWITGDVLGNAVAMDNLRKLLFDDWHSPLGGWLSSIAWIWGPIAVATLALEIGAPVALVPGRARYVWVAAVWGFHVGILAVMAISFPYQLLGVAFAAFLPVERLADSAAARLPRWAPRRLRLENPTL